VTGAAGSRSAYVVTSEVHVDPAGAATLEDAFADRLGKVDGYPGFQRLEVWRDHAGEGRYLMVSWWDDEESFRSYMRSAEHRESHARVPTDPRPRGVGLRRYTRVAD
jgi:heme-degrading monooxygenase HmoA